MLWNKEKRYEPDIGKKKKRSEPHRLIWDTEKAPIPLLHVMV